MRVTKRRLIKLSSCSSYKLAYDERINAHRARSLSDVGPKRFDKAERCWRKCRSELFPVRIEGCAELLLLRCESIGRVISAAPAIAFIGQPLDWNAIATHTLVADLEQPLHFTHFNANADGDGLDVVINL